MNLFDKSLNEMATQIPHMSIYVNVVFFLQ